MCCRFVVCSSGCCQESACLLSFGGGCLLPMSLLGFLLCRLYAYTFVRIHVKMMTSVTLAEQCLQSARNSGNLHIHGEILVTHAKHALFIRGYIQSIYAIYTHLCGAFWHTYSLCTHALLHTKIHAIVKSIPKVMLYSYIFCLQIVESRFVPLWILQIVAQARLRSHSYFT